MACTRPLKGYSAPDGKVTFQDVTHSRGYRRPSVIIKCGQCLGCRLDKKRAWAIRAVHEAQTTPLVRGEKLPRNSFITLTYDKEHLPEDNSVHVDTWQKFAKRLRKEMGPFRFLHCGEYGEKNLRPHYHAVVFGLDFSEDRELHPEKSTKGHVLWTSERLTKVWGNGLSVIGALGFDSAAYVAGYCVKKATGKSAHERYSRVSEKTGEITQVKPDYATMSLKPGLGAKWFEKYHGDVYPEDVVIMNGKPFRPPPYYDTLLERQNPSLWEEIKSKRQEIVRTDANYQDPRRLATRETVQRAALELHSNRKIET